MPHNVGFESRCLYFVVAVSEAMFEIVFHNIIMWLILRGVMLL